MFNEEEFLKKIKTTDLKSMFNFTILEDGETGLEATHFEVIPNVFLEFSVLYLSSRTYFRPATRLQPEEDSYEFTILTIDYDSVLIYEKLEGVSLVSECEDHIYDEVKNLIENQL